MSMLIDVASLSISPYGKAEINYAEYTKKTGRHCQPFVEVEFVDEEEGFVGLYPGIVEAYGVRIDRTTAGSMLRICRFLRENNRSVHKIQYALNGATITISKKVNVENSVELVVDVHKQFMWSTEMTVDALAMVGEGLEYALEQFEASLVGRDASETARTARELLAEKSKPELVSRQSSIPHIKPSDDWGSEPM